MASENYELVEHDYGKGSVKILHVRKEGLIHTIREYEVVTKLTLRSIKDYLYGDNSDIVATDTQKNTVYILAKKYGITTPEEFGLLLCKHFLNTYDHVDEVKVNIEAYPWERIKRGDKEHNHAFVFVPQAIRSAFVLQRRNCEPKISASLTNLRVLKTTKSSFIKFHRDNYRTLPDAADRVFSTVVEAKWDYSSSKLDFDAAWDYVKESILEMFSGAPDVGVDSPSVQHTLYLAEKMALDKIKQISNIEMTMPNKHYFTIDFSKFPKEIHEGASNQEVLLPADKPSGLIRAKMARKHMSKL